MKTNVTNAQKNWLIVALIMYCLLLLPEVKAQTLSLDEINDIVVQAEEGQCGAVVNFNLNAFYAEEPGSGFDLGGTFNGHTYFVTNTSEGKFWPDSEATAQSFGAHLVALNSEEESDFVRTLTTNTFWIGLNDLDSEGTFVWSNGDPVTYTGWAPGEPNNNGGGEDVVEMFPGSGEWNDAKVSGVVVSYIIEFGEITLNSNFASGSIFPVGTTTVTVTASDDAGNSIARTFNVTVEDTQAPTVVTRNIVRNLDAGNSGRNGQVIISPEDIDNGSFDECGIGNMTLDQTLFDCSDRGNNVVTLTVTDIHGNSSSATAMVTIQDVTPPEILGLNDITIDAASGTCEAVVNYTASVDDNCVAAPWFVPGFTFGGTHNGHTYFVANEANFWPEAEAIAQSYGAHLVAINDEAENEFVRSLTSSTFWIGLNDLENEGTFVWSNGDPVTYDAWGVNEPNNNNNEDVVEMSPTNGLWNDAKVSGVVPTYIIEFNSLQMQFEYSIRSGSSFPVGTTEVTFMATDGSGNTSISSFNVTVQDQEAPTIITRDISVSLGENGQVTISPEDVNDGSFDACGVAELTLDRTTLDCSDLGLNSVILSVADSSGNISTATAEVNVADNTPPSISGAEDITVEAPTGTCEAVVNFAVLAEDNCSLSVPNFEGFEFGGIFNGHSYYVSTVPNFWPQAEAIAQSLGGHLVAINDASENEFVRSLTSSTFWIGLNDLDNEGNFVWSNGDPLTFNAWGVNEPNNNNNEDVVEMSPANGLWNDAKVSGVVPTYIIEFNSTMIGEYSIASGSTFPVGSTEVTYTVTDQAGNLASTTFNVIVEDATPPIAIAQDLVVQLDQNGEASINADDVNNGSYDECGDLSSLTLEGQTSFTCSDLGNSFQVSLIVTDQAGLSSSAVGTLTIAGDNISDLNQVCNLNGDRDGDSIPDEFDPYPSDSTNNDAGAMAIFVWEDLNGNGIQDEEEPGLENIMVNLLRTDNTMIDQTSTGYDGMAYFFDISDNRLRVELIKPIDSRLTLRNQGEDDAFDSDIQRRTGRSRLLHIGSGEVIDHVDAGLWSPGTSESLAWDDLNGNGIQDETEPGIPNVLIKLTETDGTEISSALTDAQGLASLVNVPADRRVRLQIERPANHDKTYRNQGGDETLDSDFGHKNRSNKFKASRGRQTHSHIDAGLWSPGIVEAFVWNDENRNGILDSTEAGVSDVSVKLLTSKNAVIATTSTNANGLAIFTSVPADIRLRLQMETPSDYTITFRNVGTDDLIDSDFSIRRGESQTFKAQKGNELRTDIDAGLLSKSTSVASKTQVKEGVEEQVTTELVEFSAMIYPNPNKGYFKVRLEDMTYDGEASLYDLNGRLIQTQSITAGKTEIVMGKDGLEPGIYFVRINAKHALIIKKMIVN